MTYCHPKPSPPPFGARSYARPRHRWLVLILYYHPAHFARSPGLFGACLSCCFRRCFQRARISSIALFLLPSPSTHFAAGMYAYISWLDISTIWCISIALSMYESL
ncbi:uncharacterized protein SCHCODRAFT_02364603 [Schizophyllum commune H4-8]|uniref:uncharacterized protein n=1 Tax=Schizophyllum commune (strain H4-8 / FGSC 9210) TaxID=578458 RepID=UPI00216012B2|nr:uncharacterized protein SCHCODRAFT_02364603 [Schizophyllum commune H4-8]KAI5889306.1 hypothetical protein SCHCODRAFT_02364603 [Schizophyllum commune H4-8]